MDYSQLEQWIRENKSISDIKALSNKGYSTIRYWLKKYGLKTKFLNFRDLKQMPITNQTEFKKPLNLNEYDLSHTHYFLWSTNQKEAYAYILGFYLGDGCLGQPNKTGRGFVLQITNQADFLDMNTRIVAALECLFPTKRVTFYKRLNSNAIDIKLCAMDLNILFPHGKGTKHTRKIVLERWQKDIIREYPKSFIRGMLESDGCRFAPRLKACPTYIIYQFHNCSKDLHLIIHEIANQLGLAYTFRDSKSERKGKAVQSFITSFNRKEDVNFLDSFIGKKS